MTHLAQKLETELKDFRQIAPSDTPTWKAGVYEKSDGALNFEARDIFDLVPNVPACSAQFAMDLC